MDRQQIIMNFSVPPDIDDLQVIAQEAVDNLPEELQEFCDDLRIQIEEFPCEATESEMDLEDPYELVALYRSGKQIAPGVEKKVTKDDDILTIYRRPLLDLWAECNEDLNGLIRQVIIEELGQNFDFTETEIEEMNARHYQGML